MHLSHLYEELAAGQDRIFGWWGGFHDRDSGRRAADFGLVTEFFAFGFCRWLLRVGDVFIDVAVDHVSELLRDGHESGLGLVGELEWQGVAERVVWNCSSLVVGLVVTGWDATACRVGLGPIGRVEGQGLVEWVLCGGGDYTVAGWSLTVCHVVHVDL